MAETKSSIEGSVGFAKQTSKGTAATAFDVFRHTSFNWVPDVVQDEEPEAELGSGLDVEQPLRYGFRGATFDGQLRFRPGHAGQVLRAFGMRDESGGIVIWSGVNNVLRVTDQDGGPTDVNVLTGTAMVSGTRYTPTEFAAFLKEALEEQMSGTQTYTVSYDAGTKKWTIAVTGTTLSIHHSHANSKMMSNMLGFSVGADDTGSTTYTGDYARDYAGRWLLTADNDALKVTDSNGGPTTVHVLTGTGAVLSRFHGCTGWTLAAALKSALEGQMTGAAVYTVLYDDGAAANKFIVSTDAGLLTIPWTDAACTIESDLGFTENDSGSTSYTADTALVPAKKHVFIPLNSSTDFPWFSVMDQMDQDATPTLNTVLRDCRVNKVTLGFKENDVVRLNYTGRALYFSNWAGVETENAEDTAIAAPVTSSGSLKFVDTASYPMVDLTLEAQWQEQVESQLTTLYPRSIVPGRRSIKGTARVSLSSEDTGGLFKRVYYGGAAGTAPSVTLSDSPLDMTINSGQALTTTGTTEYYGLRVLIGSGKLLTYPVEKSGDALEQGQLTFLGHRQVYDWAFVLVNNEDYGAYA